MDREGAHPLSRLKWDLPTFTEQEIFSYYSGSDGCKSSRSASSRGWRFARRRHGIVSYPLDRALSARSEIHSPPGRIMARVSRRYEERRRDDGFGRSFSDCPLQRPEAGTIDVRDG